MVLIRSVIPVLWPCILVIAVVPVFHHYLWRRSGCLLASRKRQTQGGQGARGKENISELVHAGLSSQSQ